MNKKDKQLLSEAYTAILNEWFGFNKKPKIDPEDLAKKSGLFKAITPVYYISYGKNA